MKKILAGFAVFAILLTVFSSCKKDSSTSDTSDLSKDPNVYFKVSINGKEVRTDGFNTTVSELNSAYKGYAMAGFTTDAASNTTQVSIFVFGSLLNGALNNTSQGVDALIGVQKQGGALGKYSISYALGSIDDLNPTLTKYRLADNSGSVMITNIDANYVTGTFSVNLVVGDGTIPATGSFKLNKQ